MHHRTLAIIYLVTCIMAPTLISAETNRTASIQSVNRLIGLTDLLELMEEKLLQCLMENFKEAAAKLSLLEGLNHLSKFLNSLSLEVSEMDGQCLSLQYTVGNCTLGFKVARLTKVLPKIVPGLSGSGAGDGLDLLKSFMPLITNSCTCEKPTLSKRCPPIAKKITRVIGSFC